MDEAKIVLEFLRALAWPATVIGLTTLFRKEIRSLIIRIRHAELPGGMSVDLQDNIQQAQRLSQKVETAEHRQEKRNAPVIPLTEANARMIQLGLRPSPSGLDMAYYRGLAAQDPTLALAGLRIEIDVLARNLVKGFGVSADPKDSGLRLLRRLFDSGAITQDQFDLAQRVLQVCNAAIHGQLVSREQSESIIEVTEVLAEQYLAWLSWGFDDNWKPSHPATSSGV